jgi:hypothetical protein
MPPVSQYEEGLEWNTSATGINILDRDINTIKKNKEALRLLERLV